MEHILFSVHISICIGLKDLTWLLFAPNLTSLEVLDSGLVEAIISQEKVMSVIVPFQKLESLRLHNLATSKNIYWIPLPFPCLKTIHVAECPELRKLPLDAQSVFRAEEFVIKYKEREWFERVEWDDEATRLRFIPFFKFFGPESVYCPLQLAKLDFVPLYIQNQLASKDNEDNA